MSLEGRALTCIDCQAYFQCTCVEGTRLQARSSKEKDEEKRMPPPVGTRVDGPREGRMEEERLSSCSETILCLRKHAVEEKERLNLEDKPGGRWTEE